MTHIKAVIIPADYVTIEEAARLAGLHRSTITLAIHDGRLPAITCEASTPLGWRYLVRRADVGTMPINPRPLIRPLDPPRRFGQVLRRLRLRGEWSQRDLAARMGIDHGRISHYENGVYLPSTDYMARLIEALRCSPSEERELIEAAEDEMAYRARLRAIGSPLPRVTHTEPTLPRRLKHPWQTDDAA